MDAALWIVDEMPGSMTARVEAASRATGRSPATIYRWIRSRRIDREVNSSADFPRLRPWPYVQWPVRCGALSRTSFFKRGSTSGERGGAAVAVTGCMGRPRSHRFGWQYGEQLRRETEHYRRLRARHYEKGAPNCSPPTSVHVDANVSTTRLSKAGAW